MGQADLAEMAEIGQVLIDRGEADYAGRRCLVQKPCGPPASSPYT